jgi:prepilin-type N-terminal cleavage/methylation domain-containing protein
MRVAGPESTIEHVLRRFFMRVFFRCRPPFRWCAGAFTLVEVMVALSVGAIMFVGLYAGFSTGFAVIQVARENLRAVQILQEKMETIRLYNWNQVTNVGFIPTNFVETFYSVGTNVSSGILYTGAISIGRAPMDHENYAHDLRMVSVHLTWESGKVLRKREMHTLVSRYGLQNYIY